MAVIASYESLEVNEQGETFQEGQYQTLRWIAG